MSAEEETIRNELLTKLFDPLVSLVPSDFQMQVGEIHQYGIELTVIPPIRFCNYYGEVRVLFAYYCQILHVYLVQVQEQRDLLFFQCVKNRAAGTLIKEKIMIFGKHSGRPHTFAFHLAQGFLRTLHL